MNTVEYAQSDQGLCCSNLPKGASLTEHQILSGRYKQIFLESYKIIKLVVHYGYSSEDNILMV